MHLLDKRSTRALPVAAMIHDNSTDRTAPRAGDASFKFSALSTFDVQSKSLNEDPLEGKSGASSRGNSSSNSVCTGFTRPFCRRCAPGLNWPGRASGAVTLKKLECSKQAYALPRKFEAITGTGKSLKFHRDGDRSLQLLVFNEEFLVSASHQLALTTSLALCTHRPSLLPIEWSGEVLGSRRQWAGSPPATSREFH
ncbi:hypothetical protein L1887_45920 [Cichorium endivia]|nr:hypothetical protein L1887_45920 [Cichorium endivia]